MCRLAIPCLWQIVFEINGSSIIKFGGMKKVLLLGVIVMSAFIGHGQTSVYWRTDGPSSGNWEYGSTCEAAGDGQWYYNVWGGFRKRPDCFGYQNIYFDGNGLNTMNLNGLSDYYVHYIYFTINANQDRTLNSDAGRTLFLNANNGDPKIENNSTATHTFNVPITLNNWAEINPVDGDLVFNGNISLGNNTVKIYGNNSKTITFTGVLSGTGNFEVNQNSIVKFLNNNSYNGLTTINAGILELQGDLSSSTITVANGAKLRINGDNVDINALTINSGGVVEILAGKSLTVNGTLTNSAGNSGLVIENGGSLITNGTVSGSVTVKREITSDFKWHFLSSPVSGQNICDGNFAPLAANFNATTGPTYDFYKWSEPAVSGDLNWLNLKNADWTLNTTDFGATPQFGVGTGYLVAYGPSFTGSSTKSFAGTLTTGDQTIPLTTGGNKWNLIGNPFASAINWDGVTKTNLVDGYYNVYNENKSGGAGYEYYLDATHKSTGANGKISATQGFFVQASGGSIVLPNAARVHDNNWMKNIETLPIDQLMLTLSNGNNYDEAFIQFEPEGTTGKDFLDAFKMFSFDSGIPQIYTSIENEVKIAFNSMPFNTELFSIPVGVYIPLDGEYSLNVSGIESFTTTPGIILEDIQTNTLVEINQNPTYTFTAEAGDDPNRFLLHFGTVGINNPLEDTQVSIVVRDNNLLISGAAANAEIVVTNLLGQVVLQGKAGNSGLTVISTGSLNDGIYVVSVVSGKQSVSKKISLR